MPNRHVVPALTAALLLVGASIALTGCATTSKATAETPTAETVELRVSAASSLKKVLEATARPFETANGAKIVFNFGASGLLSKQIEGGAPADAFVSASAAQVDTLTAEGIVSAETTSTFAGNDLVIFVPRGNTAAILGPSDLAHAQRLVTGNPDSAPHGTKTREWLTGLGLWAKLEPRFVFAENAAQTLDYVRRGEVDAGIGFASEAKGDDAVEIVFTVPRADIKPARYVATPLLTADQPELAAAYVAYLRTPAVQEALVRGGFLGATE